MATRVPQKGATRVSPPRTSAPKESSADIERPRRQSTASFSVRTGADRVIHVFPGGHTSSGGSASVRSPLSSGGSRSPSSSDSSWDNIGDGDYEDEIDPSDSASRSRGPHSRRPTVEVPIPPARRHSSRRTHRDVEREERSPPRHRSSRRHHSRHESRHERRRDRSSSRRELSDGSSSAGTVADDYPPYGHPGMPRAPYPGYRHVPPGSHGGYPPTMASGPSAGYPDPYHDPRQALVTRDAFGYPSHANPFAAHQAQPNPFSPMPNESASYFGGAPEPPMPHMGPPPPPQRHPSEVDVHGRRGRPQSFVAPTHFAPEQAMMPYQPAGYPSPYGHPYGMPGYPMYPPGMPGYPPPPATSPPPAAPEKNKDLEQLKEMLTKKKEEDTKDAGAKNDEIAALKELIKKHEEERVAREKAWIAEREAEAAAKAAEKARAEEEKKRKAEIAEAAKKAKDDAESKAADAAKKAKEEAEAAAKKAKDEHEAAVKKAKEEHEAKLAEAQKAKDEAEKAKKALEEEAAKNKPTPDSLKAPIRFKDAVGRKFSFPWSICKTWKGMETLIKQAFLHVDVIGDHVHQGHYDLTGPDGEIILPQIWDSMIQPDWEVTMHLWPMEEEKKPPKEDPFVGSLNDPFSSFGLGGLGAFDAMPPEPGKKSKKGKDAGKKGKKPSSPDSMIMVPPPPPGMGMGMGGMPPPPPPGPAGAYPDPFGFPPGISPVMDKPKDKTKARSKSVKSKEISPLAAWFAGGNLAARPKKR
ncbi:hypothetical protein CKM354_001216900 [Cercospora kikuchii]|uniref:Ubiquitin-like domain-containing protein n=1 Tax=Cercospora kikuchii TaxID=84275 RepID=A0A9P3FLG5_9PEZI|nr:uncharacterized protein CKM354_001216900 [Cercospora kikuchii]GIZ49132.1 hypothetical protein CKM354_001216900 [Cercospora kikuchii]